MDLAHQAPLSMGFSRQEYWSGLPFPSPEDLPDPGIKPRSPAWQADALLFEPYNSLTVGSKRPASRLERRADQAPPSMGFCTGVGCHRLLQGILPTQGSNLGNPEIPAFPGEENSVLDTSLDEVCFALQLLESNRQLSLANRIEDWTSLGQYNCPGT